MILAVLKGQKLDGYILGTKPRPAENNSTTAGGATSITPNPAYEAWEMMDQALLG